jgi:hypothetical protein
MTPNPASGIRGFMKQLVIKRRKDRPSAVQHRIIDRHQQPIRTPYPHTGLRKGGRRLLSLLIGGLLLLPAGAFAQEFRGTISGKVVDPGGAVVPGASIVVLETHTGAISRTKSDSAGEYFVPFLPPGDYSITVTAKGFEVLARKGITLQAKEHPIIDLALTVGSQSQTVTVTAEAPLLNQADASIGDVISTESVADLPLNGRTPEVLAELSVGVMTLQAPEIEHPFDSGGQNSFSMGGTPQQTTESLLDGAPNETVNGSTTFSPTEDSVQEVSVRPFDTDASYGHTLGGVVNQVTKSGTNGLHGTAYEFGQVSDLNADLYFNGRSHTPTPVFHFNQYGLTVGGPVMVPKLFDGRNKLFFFFAWEGLKDKTPATTILSVPTDAEKQGDFSALLAGGPTYQLYEPNTGTLANGAYTRTPVPNNCLTNQSSYCSSVAHAGLTINPVAAAYLKFFPEPNYTTGVSPVTNQNNYNSNAPSSDNYNTEFGRLDYNFSARDHVFSDIRHNNEAQLKQDYFGNSSNGSALTRENWGVVLDDVFALNPSTVFDVRFNTTIYLEKHSNPSSIYSPTSVGFPSYMQSTSAYVALPNIVTSGYGSFSETGASLDPTTSYQVFGDVMKLLGKHTLKIGLDARQYRFRISSYGAATGSFTFANNFVTSGSSGSAQPFGGDLASLELGLPSSGNYQINALADYRSYYIASFVQDDWRVSGRLTLNLGLRYDVDTPFGEKFGRTVNGFNPTAVNSASAAATAAFIPPSVTKNNTTVTVPSINTLGGLTFPNTNWGAPYQIQNKIGFLSPRVGFSYNPPWFRQLVVRGGFGVFVQPQNLGTNDFSNQQGYSATTAYAATTNNYFTSAGTLSNPFPNGFVQPAGSSQGVSTYLGSPSAITFLAPVQHDQYSERWTLGAQKAVTGSTLVEVLYEGNHALHLPISNNINSTELQYLTRAPYANRNLATVIGTSVANPFAGLLSNGTSSYNGATTPLSNLLVPFPAYGSASITEENITIGQSYFESAMLHVEHRSSHGLTLTANYNFSKLIEAIDYLNPEDIKLERRVSTIDHTHHFTVGATYQLPFGRGKLFSFGGGRLADEILGGWVINGIYQFETGTPINFTGDIPFQPGMTVSDIKSSPRNTSPAGSGNPALTNAPGVFVTGSSSSCTVATAQACDGTTFFNGQYVNHYRTLPTTIGSVRQDGFNNLDASVLKDIKFTEKTYLQLRFETFNTLNHPIFGTPSLTPTSTSFGYITSVFTNSEPRQVQLGGRIVF